MAKKALSAPEIPLCINVLRLLNYRLAPDELILFDWLTVKQISFKYKPFHYSQARVEEETRIGLGLLENRHKGQFRHPWTCPLLLRGLQCTCRRGCPGRNHHAPNHALP